MLEGSLPYAVFILDGLFSSYSADMWALGACLLELTTGLSPVPCSNLLDLITNLRSYAGLPELPNCSSELKELLQSMLNPDIGSRPCLNAIMVGVIWENDD